MLVDLDLYMDLIIKFLTEDVKVTYHEKNARCFLRCDEAIELLF